VPKHLKLALVQGVEHGLLPFPASSRRTMTGSDDGLALGHPRQALMSASASSTRFIVRRLLGRKRKPSVLDTLNERELEVLGHMRRGGPTSG